MSLGIIRNLGSNSGQISGDVTDIDIVKTSQTSEWIVDKLTNVTVTNGDNLKLGTGGYIDGSIVYAPKRFKCTSTSKLQYTSSSKSPYSEYGRFYITTDGGQTWIQIYDTGRNTWADESGIIDLSSYDGEEIMIKVYGYNNTENGFAWYITSMLFKDVIII